MIDRNRSRAAGSSFAAPRKRLDEPQNGGQRRAQLVADIGDEVAAHLLGLAQMGDVGEMQKKRITRGARAAPPHRPRRTQRGDPHPELRAARAVGQFEPRLARRAVGLHRFDPAEDRRLPQDRGVAAPLDPVAQHPARRRVRRHDQAAASRCSMGSGTASITVLNWSSTMRGARIRLHSLMCAKTRDVTTRAPCRIRCSDNLFIAGAPRFATFQPSGQGGLTGSGAAYTQATAGTTSCRT
jgi:hypothetical protein